MPDMKTTILDH